MSKSKLTELNVDFIGGQGPLTKEEEQAISKFISAQKSLKAGKHPVNTRGRKKRTTQRRKVVA